MIPDRPLAGRAFGENKATVGDWSWIDRRHPPAGVAPSWALRLRQHQIFFAGLHLPVVRHRVFGQHFLEAQLTLVVASKGGGDVVQHALTHAHHGFDAGHLQEGGEEPAR